MSVRAISRTTGLSRQAVRRALLQTVPPTYKPRPPRPSKLDAFKDHLYTQLHQRPWVSAIQLYRELLLLGFSGHYELVKCFCRPPVAAPQASVAPQLIAWPQVSVAVRALSEYQQLIEEVGR